MILKMINKLATSLALIVAILMTSCATVQGETVETRIGNLTFTYDFADGYPTADTVQKLSDERDFQRACQAYIWAIPMVAIGERLLPPLNP